MHIVQIVPYLTPGTGVSGVAWNLDRELRAQGATVETFTFDRARRGRPFAYPQSGLAGRLARMRRIAWFRTVGTRRARAFLAARPDAVSICHSEVLAGDIFVDHGSMLRAQQAAGRRLWRILANPALTLSLLQERARYRRGIHRAIVALTRSGAADVAARIGDRPVRVATIPNGVDLARFAPAPLDERRRLRAEYGLGTEHRVALFVGHDLPGKGIDAAIAALTHATGRAAARRGRRRAHDRCRTRSLAERLGVADRVLFVGPRTDVERFFALSDVFVFPSGYEAYGLVVLEALASGVPVIATAVGCVPDVIRDGVNGYVVTRGCRGSRRPPGRTRRRRPERLERACARRRRAPVVGRRRAALPRPRGRYRARAGRCRGRVVTPEPAAHRPRRVHRPVRRRRAVHRTSRAGAGRGRSRRVGRRR